MNKSLPISIILWVLFISSCSPLTKSQVTVTRNYFSTLANYPKYFEEINIHIADVNLSAKKLENFFTEDSLKFTRLIPAIRAYEQETILPDSVIVLVDSLNNYIQEYYSLIPAGFNILGVIRGAGSAVPVFGGVAKAIPDIHLTNREARHVIRHLNRYGNRIEPIVIKLQDWMDQTCKKELLRIEEQEIKALQELDYELQALDNTYEYFAKSQSVITSYYQQIFLTRRLIDELILSMDIIKSLNAEIRTVNAVRSKDVRSPKDINRLLGLYQQMELKSRKIQKLKEIRLF